MILKLIAILIPPVLIAVAWGIVAAFSVLPPQVLGYIMGGLMWALASLACWMILDNC